MKRKRREYHWMTSHSVIPSPMSANRNGTTLNWVVDEWKKRKCLDTWFVNNKCLIFWSKVTSCFFLFLKLTWTYLNCLLKWMHRMSLDRMHYVVLKSSRLLIKWIKWLLLITAFPLTIHFYYQFDSSSQFNLALNALINWNPIKE